MTLDSLLAELKNAKPDFVPFTPYVSGMTGAEVPATHNDPCLKAAIHVYFGDLDGAHDQLQSLEHLEEASYLHGIIHRREGDFFNANYWFRRAPSISRQLDIDPESLTARVERAKTIDGALERELDDEWVALVALGLKRLEA